MWRTARVTFDSGVALLSPLWQEGADVTMASIPEVLDGQSDPSTGEEVTQPVAVEGVFHNKIRHRRRGNLLYEYRLNKDYVMNLGLFFFLQHLINVPIK